MKFKHLMMLATVALLGLAGCGRQDASQAVMDNILARRSVRSFSDKDVTPEQRATLDKLTGLLEDDEDVTNVYTTLKPEE